MTRRAVLSASTALLALLVSAAMVVAQQPPGPVVRANVQFETARPPGAFEVVQLIQEYAPGSRSADHFHGADALNTALEGTFTVEMGGERHAHAAGERWVDPAGTVHATGNETGAPARIAVVFLLPAGATLTTPQPGGVPARGTTAALHTTRFPMASAPPEFTVVQQILDFPPGSQTAWHVHGADALITVLEGQFTVRTADGAVNTVAAGQTWVDRAGNVHMGSNETDAPVSVAVVYVLPQGAAVTTNVPAPQAVGTQPPAAPAPVAAPAPAPAQMPRALPRTGETPAHVLPVALGGALLALGFGLLTGRRRV